MLFVDRIVDRNRTERIERERFPAPNPKGRSPAEPGDLPFGLDAPSLNLRGKVDGGMRWIFEFHVDYDRAARCDAQWGDHRDVRRPCVRSRGVGERHTRGQPIEQELDWRQNFAAARVFDRDGSIECLGHTAECQPRCSYGDRYPRRQRRRVGCVNHLGNVEQDRRRQHIRIAGVNHFGDIDFGGRNAQPRPVQACSLR